MNRRQFLQPGLPTPNLGFPFVPSPAPDAELPLLRFQRPAMGTVFEVVLPLGQPQAQAAASAALDEIDRLENLLSVYREQSELSRVNQQASERYVAVSPELMDLLLHCQAWHRLSAGAFDPACGALIDAWGFRQGPPRVPSAEERHAALRRSGFRHVELHPTAGKVRFRVAGLTLNFGGVGKGYALDRASEVLRTFGVAAALLVAGGSSLLALGAPPGVVGWPVRLAVDGEAPRWLALRDQGLGTSAATFRGLEHQGRRLGHLLDPRTGWPAECCQSASVLAPTAAAADAGATALFVSSPEEMRSFAETASLRLCWIPTTTGRLNADAGSMGC